MDISGIREHMPSTWAGIAAFIIGGASMAGWIDEKQATLIISVVGGIAGLLYKHRGLDGNRKK